MDNSQAIHINSMLSSVVLPDLVDPESLVLHLESKKPNPTPARHLRGWTPYRTPLWAIPHPAAHRQAQIIDQKQIALLSLNTTQKDFQQLRVLTKPEKPNSRSMR